MNPEEARKKFAIFMAQEGRELTAVRLGCSVTQVVAIATGKRGPGLQIAAAIEEAYGIPMQAWVERPAMRNVSIK